MFLLLLRVSVVSVSGSVWRVAVVAIAGGGAGTVTNVVLIRRLVRAKGQKIG